MFVMMNIRTLSLLLCFSFAFQLKAQDPHFTQFYNNPLYTNPAYAGSAINAKDNEFATRIGLAYRNQWEGTYQTVNVNWDRQFNKLHGGLGGFIINDVEGSGLVSTTNVGMMYAPIFQISSKLTIKGGLQLAYVNKRLDFSKLFIVDSTGGFALQPLSPLPQQTVSFLNAGAGLIAYMKNIHFGFAVHNITEPNQSFYQSAEGILPRRYTLHAGGEINILKNQSFASSVTPYALYMTQQNFNQLNISVPVNIGRVVVGPGFRQTFGQYGNADAIIGIAGYRAPRFHITYSYDRTISSARRVLIGSHEITMNYFISLKKNIPDLELISPSYTNSPGQGKRNKLK